MKANDRVEGMRLKGILNAIGKSWNFNWEVSGSQCLLSTKRKQCSCEECDTPSLTAAYYGLLQLGHFKQLAINTLLSLPLISDEA